MRYVWEFGFVSIPFMSLAAFAFIITMMMVIRSRQRASEFADESGIDDDDGSAFPYKEQYEQAAVPSLGEAPTAGPQGPHRRRAKKGGRSPTSPRGSSGGIVIAIGGAFVFVFASSKKDTTTGREGRRPLASLGVEGHVGTRLRGDLGRHRNATGLPTFI